MALLPKKNFPVMPHGTKPKVSQYVIGKTYHTLNKVNGYMICYTPCYAEGSPLLLLQTQDCQISFQLKCWHSLEKHGVQQSATSHRMPKDRPLSTLTSRSDVH